MSRGRSSSRSSSRLLNCNGVETSARINAGMAAALGVVIVLVLVAAVRWILHLSHPNAAFFLVRLSTIAPLQLQRAAARHFHRRAHLYRFRWHLDADRRSEGPCAQCSARHCAHLLHHRHPRQYRGLCRAARLAARSSFPRHRHRLCARLRTHGRTDSLAHRQRFAAAGQHGLRHGIATGRGAPALRHGPGWRDPPTLLRRSQPKNRIPRNNVLLIGAVCLAGALVFSYRPWCGIVELRRASGLHGRQSRFHLRGWRHGRWSQAIAHACCRWPALSPAHSCGGISARRQNSSAPAGRSLAFFSGSFADATPFFPEKPHDTARFTPEMP